MGFSNPISSSFYNAGQTLRNKLTGNTGTTDTSATNTSLAKTSNTNGFLGHDNDWWFGDNSAWGKIKNGLNGLFGTGNTTSDQASIAANDATQTPEEQKFGQDQTQYIVDSNPFAMFNSMDTSANSDVDLYNNTLNGYMGQANQAYGNAVNGINSVDLDSANDSMVSNLIRTLAAQGASAARTTGSSMASRGLAGSGVAANALNDINSSTNANIASGITTAGNNLAQNKLAQQQAVANILNNQASTLANTGTTAASNAVSNKWNPLTQSASLYTLMNAVNNALLTNSSST